MSQTSKTDPADEPEYMSAKDMQAWLVSERRDIEKARELRLKEATAFVEAYAKGEITAQEAGSRMSQYEYRWGDILHGATAMPHLTDDQIIAKMDALCAEAKARTPDYYRRLGRLGAGDPPSQNER